MALDGQPQDMHTMSYDEVEQNTGKPNQETKSISDVVIDDYGTLMLDTLFEYTPQVHGSQEVVKCTLKVRQSKAQGPVLLV